MDDSNDRFRQWCLRFKRRQKIRRGEFKDVDPMTLEETQERAPCHGGCESRAQRGKTKGQKNVPEV